MIVHLIVRLFEHFLINALPAIHEVFALNAKRFPERLCVKETKSSRAAQRTFTYRQINESSNQLANHFLTNGCEVGDVVMIYAYRGSVFLQLSFSSTKCGNVESIS